MRALAARRLLPALACCLLGLVPVVAHAFFGRADFSDAGDFSESAVMQGVGATQAQCAAVDNAVWAETSHDGAECLKYWKAGFEHLPSKRAIIFFHGDVYSGGSRAPKSYVELNNTKLQEDAELWAKKLGMPYIYMARPGTHGSSGDHMQRRRKAESELISAGLDQLKKRYGIEEWVVAGQSGGGHVTASLLTERADIVCAVPTSAPSSPRIRWEMMGRNRDTTNYADSYEPTRFITKERTHPGLRVFVLGNPKDRNVFWASQTVLADALRAAGVSTEILQGEGSGTEGHGLKNSARVVAGWCAQDLSTDEILRRAAQGLSG